LALIEVEKLSLYYDAPINDEMSYGAPSGNLIEAQKEDFEKLSADAAADNQGDLINAILSGNIKQSGNQLCEAREAGLNAISVVRALQRRITMLAAMRPQVDGGRSAAEVVKRNPAIFWKEESVVAIQLTTWTSQRLAALISHLLKMEGEIMAAKAEFSPILLEQELMRIARAAASTRRKNNAYS
jgi:DNA polymerase III delta subunit